MDILSDKWVERHLRVAHEVSTWSKDPSTKVGAVIVRSDGNPVSWGFNGFPRNIVETPERLDRSEKLLYTAHAERNALDLAVGSLRDCILFSTHVPCCDCARGIVQKSLRAVVVDAAHGMRSTSGFASRWQGSFRASLTMFGEAGILYQEYAFPDTVKTITTRDKTCS